MNHDAARQIAATGKWHYTTMNRRTGTYPIGHCSPFTKCPDCHGNSFFSTTKCETCNNKGVIPKTDPCPGHDTAEEAQEAHRQYLLGEAQFVAPRENPPTLHLCRHPDCKEYTSGYAAVDQTHYDLCPAHQTRETLELLVPSVGESWHS